MMMIFTVLKKILFTCECNCPSILALQMHIRLNHPQILGITRKPGMPGEDMVSLRLECAGHSPRIFINITDLTTECQ